jgi:hypothetical protein
VKFWTRAWKEVNRQSNPRTSIARSFHSLIKWLAPTPNIMTGTSYLALIPLINLSIDYYIKPSMDKLINGIKAKYDVPVIMFGVGASHLI